MSPGQGPLEWALLEARCAPHGLRPAGGFHPVPSDGLGEGVGSVVLIAPEDPLFWPLFTDTAEYRDGARDPLDRWSLRVIGTIARGIGAEALFPFTGPPWHPFIAWAKRTGRIHASPVGLLVDTHAGLFVSLRGALLLPDRIEVPEPVPPPCETCVGAPCVGACPVGALGPAGYDTVTCRTYIASAEGAACREEGCAVRRACPVSRLWGRDPNQSAFHMRAFQGLQ